MCRSEYLALAILAVPGAQELILSASEGTYLRDLYFKILRSRLIFSYHHPQAVGSNILVAGFRTFQEFSHLESSKFYSFAGEPIPIIVDK